MKAKLPVEMLWGNWQNFAAVCEASDTEPDEATRKEKSWKLPVRCLI